MFIIDGIIWVWDHFWAWGFAIPGSAGFLVAVLTGGFVLWRVSLALFPYKKCPRCNGSGSWGPGRVQRVCGRCDGGRLPRVGSGR